MLNLPQTLFLLSIDDEDGKVIASTSLRYGLKAAVLAELTLMGKVGLDEQKKICVLDSSSTGDEILDKELEKICATGRPRKITSWMYALGQKKLRKQIGESLIHAGVLIQDEKSFQWVIPYGAYSAGNASAKYWIKRQLRGIVLADETPELRMVVLLSLLRACRLLSLIFTKEERKAAGKRVETLARSELFEELLAKALQEIATAATEAAFASGAG